jgi:hypothetical protein
MDSSPRDSGQAVGVGAIARVNNYLRGSSNRILILGVQSDVFLIEQGAKNCP